MYVETLTTSPSVVSSSPPAGSDAHQGCGPDRDTPPAGDDNAAAAPATPTPAKHVWRTWSRMPHCFTVDHVTLTYVTHG